MATHTGMRRRGGAANGSGRDGDDDGPGAAASVSKLVKNFDMYAKVKEEYTEKVPDSRSASSFSLLAWGLTALLTVSELATHYTAQDTKEHMLVDTSLGQKLQINVNITFPALQCTKIHVDAMDVAGDYHPYMEQNMVKQRLSAETGMPVGDSVAEQANVFEDKGTELPPDYCGSCYGAEEKEGDCCDTCSAVVARYSLKGWATKEIRGSAEQCLREAKNPMLASVEGEGCNLSGFMLVNKVAGNFHVALGESVVRDGRFIHQFQPEDAHNFNASHVVHSLSFGAASSSEDAAALQDHEGNDPPPPASPPASPFKNPLDGVAKVLSEAQGTGLFQYFIKIVPTIYEDEHGDKVQSNQFAYTERFRPLAEHLGGHPNFHDDHNTHGSTEALHQTNARGGDPKAAVQTTVLPGVFWVYDLSPFMLDVTRVSPPLTHLAARLCAVAGGVSLLVSLLQYATASARKRLGV